MGRDAVNIVVASCNPVKLDAVRQSVHLLFPDVTPKLVGVTVPSGVSEQPTSDAETLEGALNRATRAHERHPGFDFGVGLEGGVHDDGNEMSSFAWVVVRAADGTISRARTGTFILPDSLAQLVRSGVNLGEADRRVFGLSDERLSEGTIGALTDGAVTRATLYAHAVTLAFVRFKQPHHYGP